MKRENRTSPEKAIDMAGQCASGMDLNRPKGRDERARSVNSRTVSLSMRTSVMEYAVAPTMQLPMNCVYVMDDVKSWKPRTAAARTRVAAAGCNRLAT